MNIATPLLYEHWYVAAYKDEISRELLERKFLNRSVVLFRKQNGMPVALQNRCAHRGFPLSRSWLKGDEIQCRYHGACYDCKGDLVSFPTVSKVPKASVISYPVVDRGPLTWIWMGAPEKADQALIPDISYLIDPDWKWVTGKMLLEGNYLLMQENLMDLSHLPFLHKESFFIPHKEAALPINMEIEETRIKFWRESSFPGYMPASVKAHAHQWQSKSGGKFLSPGMYEAWSDALMTDAQIGEQSLYCQRIPHLLTPETDSSTHYWYFLSRNFAQDDDAATAILEKTLEKGFSEDKDCVSWLQKILQEDQTPYREISFPSDKPAIAMRRIIKQLVQAEYNPINENIINTKQE